MICLHTIDKPSESGSRGGNSLSQVSNMDLNAPSCLYAMNSLTTVLMPMRWPTTSPSSHSMPMMKASGMNTLPSSQSKVKYSAKKS